MALCAVELLGLCVDRGDAARLAIVQEIDASGLTLVVVRCSGAVPTLLAGLGALLPVEVTGRAVEEGA